MVTSNQIEGRRERFLKWFPQAVNVEAALRSDSNRTPFFYFSDCADADLKNCWWVLGRLGSEIERQFSISSEVLFLFTPYDDLQRRSFNALTQRMRAEVFNQQVEVFGSVRFTPDPAVCFLWSPDPARHEKIDSWNLEGAELQVALMPSLHLAVSEQRSELTRALLAVLSSRDLYRGRNPVTGEDFFGRGELLLTLKSELTSGRSVGLFGLRRSGKTSVIREFKRRSRSSDVIVILSDLEAVGKLEDIPGQIAADLTNALRDRKEYESSTWVGSEHDQVVETFPELSARIVRAAEKNRSVKLVFALDEIESLVPFLRTDANLLRQFLGSLRRAAQSADNVSLLLTGVTTQFFDESMLSEGIENPLFGFVDALYLRPFSLEETANLVRKLGKAMALDWSDEALECLHKSAAGFPFLVRDLASAVKRKVLGEAVLSARSEPIPIDREAVIETVPLWSESAARLWLEVVRTLELHHPIMAEMVRCTSDGDLDEWLRVGPEAQSAAKSLGALGLLERDGAIWKRSAALKSLQSLDGTKGDSTERVQENQRNKEAAASRIRTLIEQSEGVNLEFKETARFNSHTGNADRNLEIAVLKTVAAFMNASGGTLLIGVADDGGIVGLLGDLKLCRKSTDRFELYLRDLLVNGLGTAVVARCVEIKFVPIGEEVICEVIVKACDEPAWCVMGDELDALYVRNGNETRQLRNREIPGYIASRFGP